MDDQTTPTPLFIVATTQEAVRVDGMGYTVLDVAGEDPAQVAVNLAQRPEVSTAIVVLDDQTAQVWAGALESAGVPYTVADSGEYAEAFAAVDDAALSECLRRDYQSAAELDQVAQAEATAKALSKAHVHDTMSVAMEIYGLDQSCVRERMSTGLDVLDRECGGGLPEGGLTVIGAGSSSGKTTLCNQMADTIAASGTHVLFVTIEQSRHELVAKSLSRMMRLTPKAHGGYYVASATHITSAKDREKWPSDKTDALLNCCARYTQDVAPRMHYFEMDGQPTMEDIRRAYEAVRTSARRAGAEKNPVLFIDYLQLMRAKDDHMTDRKAVDVNVMELRQLAREMATAVVVISSINRASYTEGADMSAFKESGCIEFSSDLALVLQPRDFGNKTKGKSEKEARDKAREAMAEHKGKAHRECEIVVLKNRGGAMPKEPVPLMFDAMCNLFTCDGSAPQDKNNSGDGMPKYL